MGESVNLLPYSIYENLGLGELQSTRTTLQLVDHSIKLPWGIIEDVLVKVDQFYYPVNFIVMDTELTAEPQESQTPVILGKPFLATANARINCHSGLMELSFRKLKVKLNIFQ